MYKFKGSRLSIQYNLLQLPVELKRLIYTFCYYPPHSVGLKHGQGPEEELIDMYAASDDDEPLSFWAAEMYTACQHPRSHLSLYTTCRQLRSELFPVFVEHHVMNMSSVFLSTEDTSTTSIHPVYGLQDVRHIALRFPPNGNLCACSVYGKCQQHFCIDLRTNVEKDISNLISAVEACGDRLRLQSIELLLPLPCNATSNAFSQYRALFRSVVYLAEVLSQKSCATVRHTERLIVQVHWPSNTRNPLKVRIDSVPKDSWDRVPDGTLILERDCAKCSSMDIPSECHTHEGTWVDVDDIVSAIAGKRTRTLTYPGKEEPKSWKVILQPGGGFKYFTHAMVELERRRQAFL